jgi:hypothetical protein
MSRIFTIDFQYHNKTYSALVTLLEKETELSLQIHIQNTDLAHILKTGQLVYRGKEGLIDLEHPDTERAELMFTIANAIEQHLVDLE